MLDCGKDRDLALFDRQIHEAFRESHLTAPDKPYQLSLALFPCLKESLGFYHVCSMADIARQSISHQYRMYYREEFDIWYGTVESYLQARQSPTTVYQFILDKNWDATPPFVDRFWFPSMKELVLLTFIMEQRGYPVWTPERFDTFSIRHERKTRISGTRSLPERSSPLQFSVSVG